MRKTARPDIYLPSIQKQRLHALLRNLINIYRPSGTVKIYLFSSRFFASVGAISAPCGQKSSYQEYTYRSWGKIIGRA
jgi:hypothetical protein